MKSNLDRSGPTNSIYRIAVSTLALVVCLGLPSFVAAQQDQPADQQSQPAQSPDATAPAAAPDSTAAPADQATPPADAPPQAQAPAGGWHYNPGPEAVPQSAAPQAPGPQTSAPLAPAPQSSIPQTQAPQGTLAPQGALPQVLTLPAATSVSVRLNQYLSSDQNHAGDVFTSSLDQPIVVDGWVVARRGQTVLGRVVLAQKAGHGNNESKLELGLTELTLVDGERLTVATDDRARRHHRSCGRRRRGSGDRRGHWA
jgi:hypothetical protein